MQTTPLIQETTVYVSWVTDLGFVDSRQPCSILFCDVCVLTMYEAPGFATLCHSFLSPSLFSGLNFDIAVHEVNGDGIVKELYADNVEALGGTNVDQEFLAFLETIVGRKVLDFCRENYKADFYSLIQEIQIKKRNISTQDSRKLTIRVPIVLKELFEDENEDEDVRDVVKKLYRGQVSWIGDKLRLDMKLFRSFFGNSTTAISSHIKKTFQEEYAKKINTIIMVGGYADSAILRQEIRETFPQKRVIIPQEAECAVLKGAVIFAHGQSFIKERIGKYTSSVPGKYHHELRVNYVSHRWVSMFRQN